MKYVYLAAQFQRKDEMRTYRRSLERYNIVVTSRWLDSAYTGPNQSLKPIVEATINVQDVQRCDTLIFFSNADGAQSTGGRHTEFGLALGLGKTTIIIGSHENVFHPLAGNTFPTWSVFEEYLAALRSKEVYPSGGRNQ